ncbi:Hpt domain-containing protein [Nitratireductor sp. XY-223]|uniref:Hpt domain-containing protein n=1 Tax=Nitratireductor sp. XY-223 TaxID=2561926 RepID=UPI0010A9D45D|nr:Hpt domain-containing protein [Nitratireductor sp. XY-223]
MAAHREIFEPPEHGHLQSPSSERPIDLVHLARKTSGDKEAETQVLCLFARQARQCVNQLCGTNHLTDKKDLLAVVRTLHGSASSVGAFCVSRAAESLVKDPSDGVLHDALTDAVVDVENFIFGLSR